MLERYVTHLKRCNLNWRQQQQQQQQQRRKGKGNFLLPKFIFSVQEKLRNFCTNAAVTLMRHSLKDEELKRLRISTIL